MNAVMTQPSVAIDFPLPDTQGQPFLEKGHGLPVFLGRTYEDHVHAWNEISERLEDGQWKLGAIGASLNTKYGDAAMKQFASDVRLSKSSVYSYIKTYRAYENSKRLEFLSFHHHTVAAAAKKEVCGSTPIEALEKAHDGTDGRPWTTRELKEYVETGREPEVKPVIALQSAARCALAAHIKDVALPALFDLKSKCPNTQFASRFYGQWIQDLADAKDELEREEFSDALKSAWRNGNYTAKDLARATGQPSAFVFSQLHDLEEAGVFERIRKGGETDEARGKNEEIWHLVGEPVGSGYSAPRVDSRYQN